MQDCEQRIEDYIQEQVTLYAQNDRDNGRNQDYMSHNYNLRVKKHEKLRNRR